MINFERGNFFTELFMNDHLKENHATGVKKDANGDIIYETDEQGNVSPIPFLGGNEADVLEYGAKFGISKQPYEYGLDAFPKLAYSYSFKPYYLDISLTAANKYPSFFQ